MGQYKYNKNIPSVVILDGEGMQVLTKDGSFLTAVTKINVTDEYNEVSTCTVTFNCNLVHKPIDQKDENIK